MTVLQCKCLVCVGRRVGRRDVWRERWRAIVLHRFPLRCMVSWRHSRHRFTLIWMPRYTSGSQLSSKVPPGQHRVVLPLPVPVKSSSCTRINPELGLSRTFCTPDQQGQEQNVPWSYRYMEPAYGAVLMPARVA